MKKYILYLLFTLSILVLGACSNQQKASDDILDKVKEKGELVVALSPEFAPFEFKTLIDGKNQIVGSDIVLAQAIADELGVELVLSEMSFDNVLNSLQAGQADLAISGISATPERAKAYDFSTSYYQAKNVILVQEVNLETYQETGDLVGKSVATQKGSVQENIAKEQLEGSHLVSLASNGTMINELLAGKVEAVILEEPIAKGYMAKNPGLVLANIELDSSETDAYAVAMAKGNDELKTVVNKVVEEMLASGAYDKAVQEAFELSMQTGTSE